MTMFGCIYQLWDWLEAPPLFTAANMDAKKLQQLQQQHQKKIPLAYQTNINDYRTATHSPVFQQQQQHQNYHMHPASLLNAGVYQQSPSTTNSSSGPLTPIDVQPQGNKLLLKHHMSGGTTSSSSHSSPYHQSQYAATEQLYQSPPERAYLAAAGRLQATSQHNPSSALQQQYQQLQAAKMQVQMATQSEAVQQQQRTFAIRQQINPPVPQGHYHMSQSSSIMSSAALQQQQQQSPVAHQRAPPSTLNLSSQFQPATGPLKVGQQQQQQKGLAGQQHYQQQEQSIYAQQQQQLQLQLQLQHQQQLQQQQHQRLKSELQTPGSEHSPVYIQQNHPGHVVNQACQTQISAVKTAGGVASKTPNSEDSTASKSPLHAPLDRKKSSGSIQALKSPITKRPAASTVTLSGWLYKQGSDGLKVWRKRWFVLAEYCLYYYKGPEEEKLLGSILLPSYRVSACLAEDKIYRKYAFKCEHQNMRTYWLAAETAESMIQWVRALTAATMMQAPSSGESDQASQPSVSSSLNHSGENSDSGIHTLQSQQSKMSLNQGPVTPASENASSGGNNANANSASSSNSGGAQPLYANAPPKPRRINDGGYSSPSPEHSIENERNRMQQHQQQTSRRSGVMSPTLQQQMQQQQQYQQQLRGQQQAQQHHAIYDTRTGSVTSALRQQQLDNLDAQFQQQLQLDDYGKSPVVAQQHYMDMEEQILRLQQQRAAASVDDIYGERELHMQKLIQQRFAQSAYPNAERRTPDAYGRSKNRVFSDYEDIYNLTQGQLVPDASYRRPMSPPSYESNKHVPLMPTRYTPNPLESSAGQTASSSNLNIRARSATAHIMRPHSADFLEYEARTEAANTTSPAHTIKPDAIRAPRPKSSLDINRTPDSFYYSEASYAEKMRKSALYLQHPQQPTTGANAGTPAQPQQPPLAVGYRHGTAEIYSPSGINTIGYENPYERVYKRNEMLNETQSGAASMPRMSRSMSGAPGTTTGSHNRSASLHPHHRIATQQQQQQQQQRDPQQQQQFYQSTNAAVPQHQQFLQHEQFLRSASARLPKRGGYDEEYVDATGMTTASPSTVTAAANSHQDGERKREESMKRLLEWKQRMLQSPLTRKGVQQTVIGSNMTAMSKLGSNPNILLASTTVASGAHHGPASGGVGAARGNTLVGGVSGIQRSRSESHANGGNGGPAAGYNSYSSDDEASISVRNVRNLPKSNLTVKPDPTDPYPQQTLENYDQMNKMTNSYYGTAHDTKYAKTTTLTDKNAGNNGGGGGGNMYFGGNNASGAIMLASSTPLHASSSNINVNGGDYYGSTAVGGGGGGVGVVLNGSMYDIHQGVAAATPGVGGYQPQVYPMRRVGSRAEIDILERETSSQMRNLDVSAGDLLSRTHEELVLLLIQLRRQSSNTARAIEQCCTDIHEVQNRLRTVEGLTRAESIQRLDYLKQHLLDLERQYEKSKPLVNLVDNMVKLGSLYRNNDVNGRQQLQHQQHQRNEAMTLDRLEFNQRIQEQRMLQEEQKQWDRLSPNQTELQSKVQQLYYLDQLLQEESGTLQSLQRDKEDLERALGGIRARIQDANSQPLAVEAAKKEQHMLERELSRVHQLLAENSKKLEQTVAGNARLEQELLVLRQKLQLSRNPESIFVSDTYTNNTTVMLESELRRVQTLVGDMQRQRQELSAAVRQLTENSTRLYQEIGNKQQQSGATTPTGSGHIKKRSNSTCWIETDLDSMLSVDRTVHDSTLNLSTPLYVDTSSASNSGNLLNSTSSGKYSDYNTGGESLNNEPHNGSSRRERSQQYRYNDTSDQLETSGVDSDGFLESNPFAGLTNQEKQEIKTVRIVKRESERRQRDRERNGLSNSTQNLDQVLEEEQQLILMQQSNGGGKIYQTNDGNYTEDYQLSNGVGVGVGVGASVGRSKSLPRPTPYAETPKSSHHHKHRHHHHQNYSNGVTGGLQQNGRYHGNGSGQLKYSDYFAQTPTTDKNSNYSSNSLTNGSAGKEHLNPLANAYFAKHQSLSRQSAQTALRQKTDSMLSLNKSITDLSPGPVFQSEAARQIINELSAGSASEDTEKVVEKVPSQHKHRRAVPREKRRHYTAPNNVNVKAMENVQAENDMNRNNTNWRARDDLDMEVALRPRINAPDVVRSALGHGEKISENTIDNLLLAPNKIIIPERYIPEKAPELSPEEKKRRQEKVESIKKMLSEAPISTANDTVSQPPSKINAEKKQREHLLQLNQILAQQVMQMSKIVAEKAMSKVNKRKINSEHDQNYDNDDDYENDDDDNVADNNDDDEEQLQREESVSPAEPLPIYQQRDNFFT